MLNPIVPETTLEYIDNTPNRLVNKTTDIALLASMLS